MMKHLLEDALDDVHARTSGSDAMSLFLDFDGTLGNGAEDPVDTRLAPAIKECLAALASDPRFVTTIISGRSLRDLSNRVGVKGLIYAANHGMEISGPNLGFVDAVAFSRRSELRTVAKGLTALFAQIRNVRVEHKDLTTAIHYRGVDEVYIPVIRDVVQMAVERRKTSLMMRTGKLAYEIWPKTNWNRGKAVSWINQKYGIDGRSSIYIGSEPEDEEAFQAIPDGISVRLGTLTKSAAEYRLRHTREVGEFLQWLGHCHDGIPLHAAAG